MQSDNHPISLAEPAEQRAAARRLHGRLEGIHTLVYFAPEVHQAHREVGLKGRMMGYTAARTAPMGPIGPEVATALFYGFSPHVLARALPDAWGFASPQAVLDATQQALADLLAQLWRGLEAEVAEAAELAREAALLHP
ncbi:MAG: helix-turn-helix domain-containing protein, partial [Actinomycetota bacterium]